ncbi:MFS transporter [Erythrobacter sp. SDW2]|uniref:MFS transporter n=1 Tax=Erythrobacter sp. SDW2 TaxID=2907154 RepID=UPI001F204E83|nr:MFS transporter [Erythrobacter sp. SDW2]UIP06162.1 MFS transporter [Erythrobacter sp. SDW2]
MADASKRQSTRFLLLYALAAAGGAVAYVPFLTVLLPVRITAMSGGEADVGALAYITLGGALAASTANILFGWLSDLTGHRRGWVIAGLLLSCALLVSMPLAQSFPMLAAMIVLWQIGLNMMLAPLAAWAGDCVPDSQKGTLGGLLALAPALGALSGALVTIPDLAGPEMRLWIVAFLVALMVLPAVLVGRPEPMPQLMADLAPGFEEERPVALKSRSAVVRMWLARLLVQIAEAALFAYLLFWFTGIDDSIRDSDTARIFAVVLGLAVPLAIVVGRWSDRRARPILPLACCAVLTAVGLVVMAVSQGLEIAIAGYVLFGLAASVFLSLHSAQTLRVLPRARRRGRDLGLFNLTNTVPSLIMPWLALKMVPLFGFGGLFWLLAMLALIAAILLVSLARFPRAG